MEGSETDIPGKVGRRCLLIEGLPSNHDPKPFYTRQVQRPGIFYRLSPVCRRPDAREQSALVWEYDFCTGEAGREVRVLWKDLKSSVRENVYRFLSDGTMCSARPSYPLRSHTCSFSTEQSALVWEYDFCTGEAGREVRVLWKDLKPTYRGPRALPHPCKSRIPRQVHFVHEHLAAGVGFRLLGSETDIPGKVGRRCQVVGLVAYKKVSDHDSKVSLLSRVP
jgi:hypothetical protein